MTDIQAQPFLQVTVDGRLLPNVTSARVTRGFDQKDGTQAQVTLSGNAPVWVKQGSQLTIRMGLSIATASQRFFGFVGNVTANLWAVSDVLDCGDVLWLAKFFKPSADVNLDGLTDEQIIARVFTEMGVPSTLLGGIGGTGKVFSDDPETALVWATTMTAGSVIEEVDQASLGWRTWVDAGGAVRRTVIVELPTDTPAYTFTEGVDILSGSSSWELPEPNNEVTVLGDATTATTVSDGGANTLAWHVNPFAIALPMLSQQAESPTQLSTDEVAAWLLQHLNQNLVTVNFVTFRDDPLSPDQTIEADIPSLRTHNLFWLQNVVTEITQGTGAFYQQVQLVSSRDLPDLGDGAVGPVGAVDPFTGGALATPPPPTLPPGSGVGAGDILVSFSLAPIDKELVIIDGTETTLYTVHATDTTAPASGAVATRAWTAAGPGVVITSGDQEEFTTGFTDLTGASITLVVTDSLGNTGTTTRPLDGGGGAPIKVRKIYAASETDWAIFDGAVWRTYTPANPMEAIAPGPQAGAGALALRTADALATPATTTSPFGADEVMSIWVEEDINSTDVAAGSSLGAVAVSSDGGATWAVKAGPGGEVRQIIRSRFHTGELHLICGNPNAGYYTSADDGDTWTLQRAVNAVQLILSHSRNVVVGLDGSLARAEEPGELFTFPGSVSVQCGAPHIREDTFYAIADDGATYVTSASGGWAMEAREPIPAGTSQVRGMDSDGTMVDLLYFAAGSGGLWKSLDGFRSPEGFLLLRAG